MKSLINVTNCTIPIKKISLVLVIVVEDDKDKIFRRIKVSYDFLVEAAYTFASSRKLEEYL